MDTFNSYISNIPADFFKSLCLKYGKRHTYEKGEYISKEGDIVPYGKLYFYNKKDSCMKTKNLWGALVLCFFSASCTEQQCIINGTTTDVKDGDYMYISEYMGDTYLDSAIVMDGKFTFKLPKAAEEDFLPKTILSPIGSKASVALVFTQDAEVEYIRDSKNDIFEIHGSPYNDLFRLESNQTDSISRMLGYLDNICLKDSTLTQVQKDSIHFKMEELLKEDSILRMHGIERNIDNLVGAYLLYLCRHSINEAKLKELLGRLPKQFSSSKYFDDVREKLAD